MSVGRRVAISSCMTWGRTGDVSMGIRRKNPHGVLAMSITDIGSGHRWCGLVCRHFDAHWMLEKDVPGPDS